MTLVVSDITRHGIVMMGDSAVTVKYNDGNIRVEDGAAKVQYSKFNNVGITIWGNGNINGVQTDSWIDDFFESNLVPGDDIESIGQRLTEQLNSSLSHMGKNWSELRCGFHLAGYKNGCPKLWHIHTGHSSESPHELRLYKDFPENDGKTDNNFLQFLTVDSKDGFPNYCHLRNGYIEHFATLFDGIKNYSSGLKKKYGLNFPQNSLQGRVEYYKLLVKFVADTLIASGTHPGVNNELSALAFNENGIVIDELIKAEKSLPPFPQNYQIIL